MRRTGSIALCSAVDADPKVISNSSMWQSERWNLAVTKIAASDSVAGAALLAFRLVLKRRHFDVVYTVGCREAEIYGMFCHFLGSGKRPHVAAEILLDEPRPGSLAWRGKRRIRRFAFRNAARVIVFSRGEIDLYRRELDLPLERIQFVPFHSNILEACRTPLSAYGFAAGRSLRDYRTFFAAAEKVDYDFIVVADRASVAHLRKPDNVELHCDIPRERYLELLQGARFVVIPSKAGYRSIGQVVVLEAASFGKPVIASDVMGLRDYVNDGVDGMLVPAGDPEALAAAMQTLIVDEAMCERIAEKAAERVEKEHTFPVSAVNCLKVIAEACNS